MSTKIPNKAYSLLRRRLELRMLLLVVLLGAALSFASPDFLTRTNIFNMLDQSVVIGLLAWGMTFVILIGGIDLSVGSVLGVTGIVFALALHNMPIIPAILLTVLTGGCIGLFSGLIVNIFGLASFVVTLGGLAIGRSMAYIISGQRAIAQLPNELLSLVYTNIAGIPSNVLFLLVVYILGWAYLSYTKGGRTIYAVGSNVQAAKGAGLSTFFYSVLPFVISGAFAAVAAVFSVSQLLSADPLMGNTKELDAIAAVVIGGASLYGGRGSMVGTFFGVLILVMIHNGLNLLRVSPFWQGSAVGGVIIIALVLERLLSKKA